MFFACNNDVSVLLFKNGTVWRVNYFGAGCLTLSPKYIKLKYIVNLLCKLNLQEPCELSASRTST